MRKITLSLLGLLLTLAASVSAQVTSAPSPGDDGFSANDANVYSVFSDFFASSIGFGNAEGNSSTYEDVVSSDEATNVQKKISSFVTYGQRLTGNTEPFLTSYKMLHLDIFCEKAVTLTISAQGWNTSTNGWDGNYIAKSISANQWNKIEIPLSSFSANYATGVTKFVYLNIQGANENGEKYNGDGETTFYIDNVYFYNYTQNLTTLDDVAAVSVEQNDVYTFTPPTGYDQKGAAMSGLTYTYAIKGDANGASVNSSTGEYTGGNPDTQTVVTISASDGTTTLTTDVTVNNVIRPFRPNAAPSPSLNTKATLTANDANVLSIYSDYFTTNKGIGNDEENNSTVTFVKAENNAADQLLQVSNFRFFGKRTSVNDEPNISEQLYFHIDIYATEDMTLNVSARGYDNGWRGNYIPVSISANQWNQFDIPVSDFHAYDTNPANTKFVFLSVKGADSNGGVIEGDGTQKFWIDNVYFYKYPQVLSSLDASFPDMSLVVKEGETTTMVPTPLDQNGIPFTDRTDVTYTYTIVTGESTDTGTSTISGSTYTAGTKKTITVVQVDAEQVSDASNTVTAKATMKNVGDEPLFTQFELKSKDDNTATFTVSAAALSVDELTYTFTCQEQGDASTKRTQTHTGVTNDDAFYYRWDGLEVGKTYTFTAKAAATIGGTTYTSDEESLNVAITAVPVPDAAAAEPATAEDHVVNLYSDKYTTSALWIKAAAVTDDDLPSDGYFQGLFASTTLPANTVWYVERAGQQLWTLAATPIHKNWQFTEASAAKQTNVNYKPLGDSNNMLRITQLDHVQLLFGADNEAGGVGFDCTPEAPIHLTSMEMDIWANEAADISLNFHNILADHGVSTITRSLAAGWNHISFSETNDAGKFERNDAIFEISIYGGDGFNMDAQNVLYIDNIYFVSDVETTFRQLTDYTPVDDTYNTPDANGIAVCKTDDKIKMVKFTGMFDNKKYHTDSDILAVLSNKDINWFDFRDVIGINYNNDHVRAFGGNNNAFMLTEPLGALTTRGPKFPLFVPNNVYIVDGTYYGTYMILNTRWNDQYIPTNKNLAAIYGNGVETGHNYGLNVYSTLILPYKSRMEVERTVEEGEGENKVTKTLHPKAYAMEAEYENITGVSPQIRVFFKQVTETVTRGTTDYYVLEENTPYLIVTKEIGIDNAVSFGNYDEEGITGKAPYLTFDDSKAAETKVGGGNALSFKGTYKEIKNPSDGNTYVFKPSTTPETANTLAVAKLKTAANGGLLRQCSCYFDFSGMSSEAKSRLSFYFKEDNGETTSVRLATEDEVKAIVGGIYSIDGKRVAKSSDDASKLGLSKGIYVINGKKVVIK